MFVCQLCTKVRIRRTKDGLGVRIYNARKCGLYESRASESRGPLYKSRAVVTEVRSANPKGSATSSQGIRGCISVMATLKFTFLELKKQCFVKNNRRTSLTGDVFISYDR